MKLRLSSILTIISLGFLCLSSSCNISIKKHSKHFEIVIDSTRYDNLILGTALNSHLATFTTVLPQMISKSLREDICRFRRETKDSLLGILMRYHRWGDGQEFGPAIIYVTNTKGFEYVFPFRDECYYYSRPLLPKSVNDAMYDWVGEQPIFERQFNYLLDGLGLNKKNKENERQRFITLYEDSLLKPNPITYGKRKPISREITLKDTDDLHKMVKWEFHLAEKKDLKRLDTLSLNVEKIITDLKTHKDGSVRYFMPIEGSNAFWRFERTELNDSTVYMNITFENKDFYKCFFW